MDGDHLNNHSRLVPPDECESGIVWGDLDIMAETGLTQALAISISGLVILVFDTVLLGQIVDLFVYYASTWELYNPVMRACMQSMILFGQAFYWVILILAICFVVYPVIYVIKRHRYMDIETADDQALMQSW